MSRNLVELSNKVADDLEIVARLIRSYQFENAKRIHRLKANARIIKRKTL